MTTGVYNTTEVAKQDVGSTMEQVNRGIREKPIAKSDLRRHINVDAPKATVQEL